MSTLSVEELMRKRVIVENLWPGCSFSVGDILIEKGGHYMLDGSWSLYGVTPTSSVEPFPYLMRPLPWWAERSVEQMPGYLKHGKNGKPRKVKRYYRDYVEFEGGRTRNISKGFLPSTPEEYNEYLKTKQ